MEWNFLNRTNHTFYRLLIQPKRAYGDDALLSRHTYRYLSHRTSGGRYQADILWDVARPCAGPVVEGVNLANGYSIRRFARIGKRNILGIRPHMHSLTRLFCPPGRPARIPRPRRCQRLLDASFERVVRFTGGGIEIARRGRHHSSRLGWALRYPKTFKLGLPRALSKECACADGASHSFRMELMRVSFCAIFSDGYRIAAPEASVRASLANALSVKRVRFGSA